MSKRCVNCGSELPDTATFCWRCGKECEDAALKRDESALAQAAGSSDAKQRESEVQLAHEPIAAKQEAPVDLKQNEPITTSRAHVSSAHNAVTEESLVSWVNRRRKPYTLEEISRGMRRDGLSVDIDEVSLLLFSAIGSGDVAKAKDLAGTPVYARKGFDFNRYYGVATETSKRLSSRKQSSLPHRNASAKQSEQAKDAKRTERKQQSPKKVGRQKVAESRPEPAARISRTTPKKPVPKKIELSPSEEARLERIVPWVLEQKTPVTPAIVKEWVYPGESGSEAYYEVEKALEAAAERGLLSRDPVKPDKSNALGESDIYAAPGFK